MSRPGRRSRGTEHAEEHVDERWMASYMDMVTVLMCLFIVLFAMSTVDQEKFTALKNSLATGFGTVEEGKIDTASGIVVPPEKVSEEGDGFTDVELAVTEVETLVKLRDQLRSALEAQNLAHAVTFVIDQRGLTIGLIGWETFFQPNSIDLQGEALAVVDTIGPILAASAHSVSVEGHADYRGSPNPFPTDWELSGGRATQVLRRMVETAGFPGGQISAVGYGSTRPQRTGETPEDMAFNRRVDIAVLSPQPEAVRELIPDVLANGGKAPAEPEEPAEPPAAPAKAATPAH
ncbi:chemotaxis protein MotB [Microterricola gilva]|uniref:Chemotaxis protein MotB n=1 Tax=Microterricola gilva TaxID=393267 RepID=A0A4V2GAT3_9MICO|nr:flagellar motor protein MotB [Microterricola gilva]RZU65526.1 chemotaxis protein MotB [Microterricola gilva]